MSRNASLKPCNKELLRVEKLTPGCFKDFSKEICPYAHAGFYDGYMALTTLIDLNYVGFWSFFPTFVKLKNAIPLKYLSLC
ncbi:MAG: hypothetical protein NZO16_06375 [Deltaproteobacteria bacterium]|nr:hypothetical protein [Deltaproteobacteria bacterium]